MAEDAFLACQNTIQPRSTEDIITTHSSAMASLMKQMGITTCVTVDHKTDVIIATSQTGVSVGCEQIAIMSQFLDTAQQVLQCSVSATSQTTNTQVMLANNITVRLTEHATISCLNVQQTIQGKVASVGEFGTQTITDMGSYINDTIRSFATNVQDSSKDITTVQGQKSVMAFTQQLEQTSNQSLFSDIVQESINNFQASNNFVLEMSGYSFVGIASPNSTTGCVTIVQAILMEVLVQNIMNATLDTVFSTDVAHSFVAEWNNVQKAQSQTTPSLMSELGEIITGSIMGIIIIAVVVVAVLMLLKGGNNNIMSSPTSGNPGDKGKGISIFFIVLGVIVFIAGIACAATGFSTIVGGIAIAVGAICIAIAGYMLYVAMKVGKAANAGTK